MARTLIPCADLVAARELAELVEKTLPGTYPRRVGETAWQTPPAEDGSGGVPYRWGKGWHAAVTIAAHVAPRVDPDTGAVSLPLTPEFQAALAADDARPLASRRLAPSERARLSALSGLPAVVESTKEPP